MIAGMGMDPVDKKILNLIQEEFPLDARPYARVAEGVGISEEEALTRVRRLVDDGYIRRIGLVLEGKKLGYVSLLCATHASPERIDEIAGVISAEPGVTHNYERDHELNLWFTITMKKMADIDNFLSGLENRFAIKIYRFPEKKRFKIKTYFPL